MKPPVIRTSLLELLAGALVPILFYLNTSDIFRAWRWDLRGTALTSNLQAPRVKSPTLEKGRGGKSWERAL